MPSEPACASLAAPTGCGLRLSVSPAPGSTAATAVPCSWDGASGPSPGARASSLETDAVSERDPPLAGEAGGGLGTAAPSSSLELASLAPPPTPADSAVASGSTAGCQSGAFPGQGNMAGGLTGEEMTSERRLLFGGEDRGVNPPPP